MITASKLAGSLAAHAIWSLSDGEGFDPMFGYTTADDERKMERLVSANAAEAVELGRSKLAANPMDAADGVLLYDGRIPDGAEKIDAVIIEMRAYIFADAEAVIAVPYTPKTSGTFRVHRPRRLVWKHCEDFDADWALESFFEGVDSHAEGSKVWKMALDPSK